jgi:outer membrane biosynthesis protein TonB
MDADQIAQDVAEQVREIVAQAERTAAQIIRDAERDAERIRAAAESESEGQLALVRGALAELQSKLGTTQAAPAAEVEPGPVTVPEPEPPLIPEPAPDPVPEPFPEPVPEPTPPPDEGTPPQAAAFEALAAAAAGRPSDTTGARLVAMNMALDGASREAIEGHLAETYALEDVGAIVDDVLALAQT